jgi:hypothetical protein
MEISARRTVSVFFTVVVSATFVFPASREPFPLGYSMANGGTIIQQKGISGREPFTPACFYADTFRYGVSVAGVDYYDAMDNMQSSHMYQAGLGGFCSIKGFTAKLSLTHFDALRVYFEQEGRLSFGTTLIPFVNPSIEVSGYLAGPYDNNAGPVRTCVDMGVSMMAPFRLAAVSLSCSHIPLKTGGAEGYGSPLTVRAGVHTTANALGGQGMVCEIQNDGLWRFRLSIGEEYWLMNRVALAAAFTTNPVVISFGVIVAWKAAAISAGFVEHPVLGWSKGLAVDWAGK